MIASQTKIARKQIASSSVEPAHNSKISMRVSPINTTVLFEKHSNFKLVKCEISNHGITAKFIIVTHHSNCINKSCTGPGFFLCFL